MAYRPTDEDIRGLASYDVILAPSHAEATALGARAARELEGGLLSCEITTYDGWVEHLWEIWGDGRRFVGSSTRVLAMREAIRKTGNPALPLRPRTAVAASNAHRAASGSEAYETALVGKHFNVGLNPAELALLKACAAYDDLLDRMGLVEQGKAASLLARDAASVFGRPLRVGVVGSAPLSPVAEELLQAGMREGKLSVGRLGEVDAMPALGRASEGVTLRFAFPSGRYAEPQLLIDVIDQLGAMGSVVVAAKDPASLYEAVAPALAARGIRCAMRGSRPFAHTSLGRAYCSLAAARRTRNDVPWCKAALADAVLSPFSRRTLTSAWRWDEQTRADRLLSYGEAVARIAEGNQALCTFLDVVDSPSSQGFDALDGLVDAARGFSLAERDEQHDAIAILRELSLSAQALGIESQVIPEAIHDLLDSCSVGVRGATCQLEEGARPDVLIESLSQAATTGTASCATMVVLDLDSESYPSTERDDACTMLLDKLGVPRGEGRIDRLRRQFAAVVDAPTSNLVLGRCLNDVDANPTYPCALIEEFVDLYRSDPSAMDDIDNEYALPAELQRGMFLQGEEALLSDVAAGIEAAPTAVPEPALSDVTRRNLVAYRHEAVGQGDALVLSPAQIEAYLLCPGLWLATRRLLTNTSDEGFGNREQGIYRHEVLQGFYGLFRGEGHAKVTADNMDDARKALALALVQEDARGRELTDSGQPRYALNRCVAVPGSTEERAMARVKAELYKWLPFEAEFLRGPHEGEDAKSPLLFTPRAFELDMGEFGVTYAGATLVGRIDRVDVSCDDSSAVVVDYKGSLDSSYSLELAEDGHLEGGSKVQALVYASAVESSSALRRRLCLHEGAGTSVAGALYVSYKRGNEVRGHYDSDRVVPGVSVPQGMGGVRLSGNEFQGLLARVEEEVAHLVVEPLLKGNVDPAPTSSKACERCPNVGCCQRRF